MKILTITKYMNSGIQTGSAHFAIRYRIHAFIFFIFYEIRSCMNNIVYIPICYSFMCWIYFIIYGFWVSISDFTSLNSDEKNTSSFDLSSKFIYLVCYFIWYIYKCFWYIPRMYIFITT